MGEFKRKTLVAFCFSEECKRRKDEERIKNVPSTEVVCPSCKHMLTWLPKEHIFKNNSVILKRSSYWGAK